MAVNIIDSYQFGLIVINGKKYTSDVIIFPDSVKGNWYRKTGHQLCLEDIAEVITENPEGIEMANLKIKVYQSDQVEPKTVTTSSNSVLAVDLAVALQTGETLTKML